MAREFRCRACVERRARAVGSGDNGRSGARAPFYTGATAREAGGRPGPAALRNGRGHPWRPPPAARPRCEIVRWQWTRGAAAGGRIWVRQAAGRRCGTRVARARVWAPPPRRAAGITTFPGPCGALHASFQVGPRTENRPAIHSTRRRVVRSLGGSRAAPRRASLRRGHAASGRARFVRAFIHLRRMCCAAWLRSHAKGPTGPAVEQQSKGLGRECSWGARLRGGGGPAGAVRGESPRPFPPQRRAARAPPRSRSSAAADDVGVAVAVAVAVVGVDRRDRADAGEVHVADARAVAAAARQEARLSEPAQRPPAVVPMEDGHPAVVPPDVGPGGVGGVRGAQGRRCACCCARPCSGHGPSQQGRTGGRRAGKGGQAGEQAGRVGGQAARAQLTCCRGTRRSVCGQRG
jgi:hypothetical protein